MTKEEKIKEAYGEAWYYFDNNIQEKILSNNGFTYEVNESWLIKKIQIGLSYKDKYCRPLSLQGIENNNGWIKIESEEDLPKENGEYHIINSKNEMWRYNFDNNDRIKNCTWLTEITHYQPIEKPKPPIY